MTELVAFISTIALIISIVVHIIIALAIYSDAQKLQYDSRLWLLSPGIYAFSGLLLGLIAAAIYWTIHYSTLRSTQQPITINDTIPENDNPK